MLTATTATPEIEPNILRWGTDPEHPRTDSENRRVVLTNQISLLLLLVSAPYFLVFWGMNQPLLSVMILPLDIAFVLCLFLNRAHKTGAAKLLLLCAGNAAAFLYANLLTEMANAQLLFFAFAGIPLLLFSHRERFKMWGGVLLSVILYFVSDLTAYSLVPWVTVTPEQATIIRYTAAACTFLIIVLYLRFLVQGNRQAERMLHNANHAISNEREKLEIAYHDLQSSRSQTEAAVRRAAELEGVAKTVVTINHELNSPLTALITACKALKKQTFEDPVMEKLVSLLDMACGQITRIVSQLEKWDSITDTQYLGKVRMLDLRTKMGIPHIDP